MSKHVINDFQHVVMYTVMRSVGFHSKLKFGRMPDIRSEIPTRQRYDLEFKNTECICTESNLNKKLMIHVAFNCIIKRWWLPNR